VAPSWPRATITASSCAPARSAPPATAPAGAWRSRRRAHHLHAAAVVAAAPRLLHQRIAEAREGAGRPAAQRGREVGGGDAGVHQHLLLAQLVLDVGEQARAGKMRCPAATSSPRNVGIDVLDVEGGHVAGSTSSAARRIVVGADDLLPGELPGRAVRIGVQHGAGAADALGGGHQHAPELAATDDADLRDGIGVAVVDGGHASRPPARAGLAGLLEGGLGRVASRTSISGS
jgi:hypothetical protein